jgi:hypothetical protein
MAKYNKPFHLPGSTVVKPMKEQEFGMAGASAGEKALFDSIAQEHIHISGTPLDFYVLDRAKTTVDPLYGEATEKIWKGPYKFRAHFQWPNPTAESREEGFRETYRSECWIVRKDFEELHCPMPDHGDIIRVWNIPYFNTASVSEENVPHGGYFFNVVQVQDDGHMFDNPEFSGFRLSLTRLTEFSPERRIYPP